MNSITDRLEEQLLNDDAPDTTVEWRITDMDLASWASRKAAKAHQSIVAVDDWEAREIDRIRRVAEQERAREQRSLEFFTDHLGAYLATLIAEGRKVKSLELPGGKIALRSRPVALEVLDDDAIAWAQANGVPEVLRTKVSFDKKAFREATEMGPVGTVFLRETGEELPFARWSDPGQSASFTPAKGAHGE